MRRVLVGVVILILILGAVLITRTLSVDMPPEEAASAPPPGMESAVVAQHLSQAIKFETVSYGDGVKEKERNAAIAQFRAWMEQTYPYLHEAAPQEQVGESLLYVWRGTNDNLPPVLLMAHMDVVPVVPGTEKDWTHAPFSGDIADGFVWGRGALDDKAALVAILDAGERLAAGHFQPTRTIMFAFGQDEEVGGAQGNSEIAKRLAMRGVHFAWVLDEGMPILNEPFPGVRSPIALLGVAEKGYLSLELVAHGEGGHSSRPTQDMALPRLASAISNVVGHPFVSDLDSIQTTFLNILTPRLPFIAKMALANMWLMKPLIIYQMESRPESAAVLHTTISPTIISGGVKDNVIPATARAVVNFRLHPRDTIASVTEHVRQAINDPKVDVTSLMETRSEASKIVGQNDPAYLYIADLIKSSFAVPVAPQLMVGATDSVHYLAIADAVLRFWPFPLDHDDLPRIHGTNERIAVDHLGPAVGFYMRVMQSLK